VTGSETLGAEERQIVQEVFEAGDRQIREIMVPRTEVDFIAIHTPADKAAQFALEKRHSRYPVTGESSDDVVGFVHVRDLFNPAMAGRPVRIRDIVREVFMLPATRHLLSALTDMRREGAHLAIVVDEYGGTAGIITLEDLVEEIIGDIKDEYDEDEPETTRSLTGEIEVDGLLNLDDVKDEAGLVLPEGPYETVAGYIVQQLGHVPAVGESVMIDDHELTVVELDGRRVARVKITPPVSDTGPRLRGATAASVHAIEADFHPALDRTADPAPDPTPDATTDPAIAPASERPTDPALDRRP
jgi:putative hemolysin